MKITFQWLLANEDYVIRNHANVSYIKLSNDNKLIVKSREKKRLNAVKLYLIAYKQWLWKWLLLGCTCSCGLIIIHQSQWIITKEMHFASAFNKFYEFIFQQNHERSTQKKGDLHSSSAFLLRRQIQWKHSHTHGEFQAQFIYCHWHKYGDTNECDENKQLKGNPQKRNVHILEGKKTIFNDIGAECEGVYRAMTTPNDKMQCKEVKLWHMKHTFSK